MPSLNPLLKTQHATLLAKFKQIWYLDKIYEKVIFVLGFFSLIFWGVYILYLIL